MIDGDEYDFLTKCKRFFSFRAGERKRIKARYNRRARRAMKMRAEDRMWEWVNYSSEIDIRV